MMTFWRYCLWIFLLYTVCDPIILQAGERPASLELKIAKGYLKVEALYENVLHVTYSLNKGYLSKSMVVVEPGQIVKPRIKKSGSSQLLMTSGFRCEVSVKMKKLSIKDPSGQMMYLEAALPGELIEVIIRSQKKYKIRQSFRIDTSEALYGLGMHADGILNLHAANSGPARRSIETSFPFLLSAKNYGILWDNDSRTEFSCCGSEMSFSSDLAGAIDFYIITGKDAEGVIAGYRKLTGGVPMLPRWSWANWPRSLEAEVKWADSLPAGVKTGDTVSNHAGKISYLSFLKSIMLYEKGRSVGDSKRMMILSSRAWPGQQRTGAITCSGDKLCRFEALKKQVTAGISLSLSGDPLWHPDLSGMLSSGIGGQVSGDARETGSHLIGQQGTENPLGSGDPAGSYIASQCREYPLGIKDLAWRELFIRWFQLGTFCPIFNSRNFASPGELLKFGEKGSSMYETLLQWEQYRFRLAPYIYSLAWKMHSEGYTLMRGLAMDFASDKNVHGISDEFMFGPSFLVRPVSSHQYYNIRKDTLQEQQPLRLLFDSVDCYLPAGTSWFDLYTGRRYKGGQTIHTPSPLEVIPVFIREGSILPYAPLMRYSGEKPDDPVELRIYPGADAEFSLYEDENEGYNYEKGEYAIIPIRWSEKTQTLTAGKRQGGFPGMLQTRTFKIILVDPEIPEGFSSAGFTEKEFRYNGDEISVKIK